MNFVATGLNERYWNPWGIAWAVSLRKVAQTAADIVVLNYGLSLKAKGLLESLDIQVIDGVSNGSIRRSALLQVAKSASKGGDKIAYFDADIWFQQNFDDLFEKLEDSKLRLTNNMNQGFVAGDACAWGRYCDIAGLCRGTKEERVYEVLVNFFGGFYEKIDHRYNCPNVHQLVDVEGVLNHLGEPVSGIHFTGPLKTLGLRKNVSFQERHIDLFGEYINSRRSRHFYFGKLSAPKS